MTPIFRATVTYAGDLRVETPTRFRTYLARLKDKPVEVIVRRVKSQRSLRANAYYRGVVVKVMAEEFGYDPQEMHEVLAMRFLRVDDCPITGAPRRRRTPDCDTREFAEYVDACIRLATEHGLYVPQPGEVELSAK